MAESILKFLGLKWEEIVECRLSIGNAVAEAEYNTGNFSIVIDAQKLNVIVKNSAGRVVWKSIHNYPFVQSTLGHDYIGDGEGGCFKIEEHDERLTVLQTITTVKHTDKSVTIQGGIGHKLVPPTHTDYTFTFIELSPKHLQFQVRVGKEGVPLQSNSYRRVIITYESHKEEDFYGFGEQFSYGTLKGQKVPILVREQGVGRGAQPITAILNSRPEIFGEFAGGDSFTTYAPIPQYITTDNRCVFLENNEYSSFDLRKPDRVVIRVNSPVATGRVVDGDSMLELISSYTEYSGRMRALPEWVGKGAIAGMQGGEEKVRAVYGRLKEYDVPVVAFWLQDWCGKRIQKVGNVEFKRLWWNWESDNVLYPHWGELVTDLKADNVRMLNYVNTFLADVKSKPSAKRNLYQEASEKGLLVKDAKTGGNLVVSSGPEWEAGLLDITNPECREWFKTLMKESVFQYGVSGMMTDFGEYTPYDSAVGTFHSGVPAEEFHNQYPQEWAKLAYEVVQELGLENEAVMFHRSAFTKSPGYMNLMWAGDQNTTWDEHDGIRSAVTGMLNGGFSGLSITHSDIGGYTTFAGVIPGLTIKRDKELLLRWMELSAFTCAFRTHEGINPDANAQFYDNEDTYIHFGHTAKLFASIAQYRQRLLEEAQNNGYPVMRHPVLLHSDDKKARAITFQQYYLGDSLLIAPVLSPSTTYVKVYFPLIEGVTWRHIWTGKYYQANGSKVAVDAPVGQPPVFVKEPREDDGLLNDLLTYAASYYEKSPK
ncbi:glycosyl hydrolases family 31-domain-containing protein [Umbelopsis sp. PMI_123]|nr:glycosyl hydrolases family 31-domain-containing protein [Umbelopsis sp. PMI_123]